MDIDIPTEEMDKLFPFVPINPWGVVVTTVITLGILLFDASGKYSTNPVVFYSIPLIYSLIFLSYESFQSIPYVIGLYFESTRSKIVAVLSIPLGLFVGWGFVQLAMAKASIFKIATYPWAVTSLATAGTLSTFTPSTSFVLYFFVALFEEVAAIIMGKNLANWLYTKGFGGIWASLVGYLLGRIALTAHHWFSYGGLQSPTLYLSAIMLFAVFTLLGILTAIVGSDTGDKLSDYYYVPILLPVMVAAHFAFDFVISQLMVIG